MIDFSTKESKTCPSNLLDGFRWSFDTYFENGERISSSGRHVMPDGKGLRRIEILLHDAAEAAINMTQDKHKDWISGRLRRKMSIFFVFHSLIRTFAGDV